MGPSGDRMALCVARGIYMAMCRKKSGMSDRPQRWELRARTPVGLANCKASRPQDSNRSVRSEIPATSKPSTSRRDVAALSFTHMLANLPGQSTVGELSSVAAHLGYRFWAVHLEPQHCKCFVRESDPPIATFPAMAQCHPVLVLLASSARD